MRAFLAALQFLTIAPIRLTDFDTNDAPRSLIFFPLIGFLIGIAAWVMVTLSSWLGLGMIAAAVVPVITLAVVTAGLHLDGLCDTADALLSGKNKTDMLIIMRDPHCGAMGMIALICCFLLKVAFLAAIPISNRGSALCLACVAGRWPLVLSMYLFPYARGQGKALPFMQGINGTILLIAAALACGCSLIAGWKGLMILAACSLFVAWFGIYVTRKIGGITGDTLGASVELAELCALFLVKFI